MTPSPLVALRSSWQALTRFFWPTTPEQEERDYQARLVLELHIRQQLLINLRRRCESCRSRLGQLQKDEGRLAGRELERNRRRQQRLRERLQRVEQKYQRARNRFERLKRERALNS